MPINVVKYKGENLGLNLLIVHDNEDTGLSAGLAYIAECGGTVTDSQYGGGRNFSFYFQNKEYHVDPNSIYSMQGIYGNLKKYSSYNKELADSLIVISEQILSHYSGDPIPNIITLHNNSDEYFSVWSFLEGGELQLMADSVYYNPDMDEDDFVIVTNTAYFNYLKKHLVSVVLQSNNPVGDGSLSVFAHQRNIPYVNIEAQHGHYKEQLRLIKIVDNMIKATPINAQSRQK